MCPRFCAGCCNATLLWIRKRTQGLRKTVTVALLRGKPGESRNMGGVAKVSLKM
jgi:hypothetical protein